VARAVSNGDIELDVLHVAFEVDDEAGNANLCPH